jgi:hypothetical protein
LTVGHSRDKYEQEADQMADQVLKCLMIKSEAIFLETYNQK